MALQENTDEDHQPLDERGNSVWCLLQTVTLYMDLFAS